MGKTKKLKHQRRLGYHNIRHFLDLGGDHLGPICSLCNRFFEEGAEFRQLVFPEPTTRRINLCMECAAEFGTNLHIPDLGEQGTVLPF